MDKKKKQSERFTKKQMLRFCGDTLILIAGNAVYALAVVLFVMSSGLVTGGVTGIGMMINHFTGIEVSYTVFAFNVVLFIAGAIVIGKHFALATAASTVLYPMFLYIFEHTLKGVVIIQDDLGLCAACAGIMIGFAVGFVARTGASTGGMDVPPLIINKLTGFPVGTMLCILDATVITSQLPISSIRQMLYGILMVVVYSYVINQVMVMGNGKVQINLISNRTEEVRQAILTEVHRGVTLLSARRGLSGEPCDMVLSIVSSRQLARVKKIILDVDPAAFMIINKISEVNGNGFSFFKGDKLLDKTDVM